MPVSVRQDRASDAEVRQFRRNATRIRIEARGLAREIFVRLFAGPLAVRQAVRGVRQYGVHVHRNDGVSRARQFERLVSDYRHRIRPDDFYQYRLHLDANRHTRHRHFTFMAVLEMQQYLIEATGAPDYPLLRSKSLFAAKCAELALPTVPLLAAFVAGVSDPADPELPDADLFVKPTDMMLGTGTARWTCLGAGVYRNATDATTLTGGELCEHLARASRNPPPYGGSGGLVLQRRQINHPSMLGVLTTGSLATIRLVTCSTPEGEVCVLPPILRMPIGNAIADNLSQGGIAAPVDAVSGRITGPAIRVDERTGLSFHPVHPDTGATLAGVQLPFWQEILALGERAHRSFPSLHFIGWDIAPLEHGPVLLEGNAWWGADLTVMPHGMALADTAFVALYNHHFAAARRSRSSTRDPGQSLGAPT